MLEEGKSRTELLLATLIRIAAKAVMVRTCRCWVAVGLLTLAGCGGGGSTPSGPAPIPSLPASIHVAPLPLRATFVDTDGTTSNFRTAVTITVAESRGTGVQIAQFTATITTIEHTAPGLTLTSSQSHTTSWPLQISPGGTAVQSHTLGFGVTSGETVTCQFQVTGVDSQGRSFLVSTGSIPVELTVPGGSGGA